MDMETDIVLYFQQQSRQDITPVLESEITVHNNSIYFSVPLHIVFAAALEQRNHTNSSICDDDT
jgi:hypothetical protein